MSKNKKAPSAETTNIYKAARLRAAQVNPELSTAEKAAQLLFIRREKYLQIEQDDPHHKTTVPTRDEVAMMIRTYCAPELRNYYCANECPLGEGIPLLQADSLDRISVQLMIALRRMELARDEMDKILVDGIVSETEADRFKEIVHTLKEIAIQASALELWAQKNGLSGSTES